MKIKKWKNKLKKKYHKIIGKYCDNKEAIKEETIKKINQTNQQMISPIMVFVVIIYPKNNSPIIHAVCANYEEAEKLLPPLNINYRRRISLIPLNTFNNIDTLNQMLSQLNNIYGLHIS